MGKLRALVCKLPAFDCQLLELRANGAAFCSEGARLTGQQPLSRRKLAQLH